MTFLLLNFCKACVAETHTTAVTDKKGKPVGERWTCEWCRKELVTAEESPTLVYGAPAIDLRGAGGQTS